MRLHALLAAAWALLGGPAFGEATPADTLTDAAILDYASRSFDKGAMMHQHVVLGMHKGTPAVADFPCSDVCPADTVRVVHYDLRPDQRCADIGGVGKERQVPAGIATHLEHFRFPKVLTDHWNDYVR